MHRHLTNQTAHDQNKKLWWNRLFTIPVNCQSKESNPSSGADKGGGRPSIAKLLLLCLSHASELVSFNFGSDPWRIKGVWANLLTEIQNLYSSLGNSYNCNVPKLCTLCTRQGLNARYIVWHCEIWRVREVSIPHPSRDALVFKTSCRAVGDEPK